MVGALFALALVLFLAWFTLRFLNKRMPGFGTGGGRLIHVLDRVSLGKSNTLLLVRVQEKVFLVAMSEHAIETISEIDDPDGTLTLPAANTETMGFSDSLKDAVAKLKERGNQGGPGRKP